MSSISVDIPGYHCAVRLLASGLPSEGWGQKASDGGLNFGPRRHSGMQRPTHAEPGWAPSYQQMFRGPIPMKVLALK